MGVKHKKTRKQKIIADLNRQTYSLENKSSTFSHGTSNLHEESNASGNFRKVLDKTISSFENLTPRINIDNHAQSYSYVLRDVSKTLIITSALIGLQMLLFFLLKNHIIILPKIGY